MASAQEPAEQKPGLNPLESCIQGAIAQNDGWITFDRFMHMALYTPGLGYYSGGEPKFGATGDFITAPEMGDLFGRCLAGQLVQVFAQTGDHSILEFGAGSGALAATLLNELGALGSLPEQYLILEVSGQLRARQEQTIRSRAPNYFDRVRWLDQLPEAFIGAVIANEVLDAMPVKLFELSEDEVVKEIGVALGEDGEDVFTWQTREAGAELTAAVADLNINAEGVYRSEISLQIGAWLHSLARASDRAVVFLIDYGFPRSEFYHPDRSSGTLMCHYQHRAHADPFYRPGQQDITAHVDFTALALVAEEAGFTPLGYAGQGAFLLGAGLLERIPLDVSSRQQLNLAQEVKKLTMPHEMGELFKVLVLARHCEVELSGFAQYNHLHRLTKK